MPCDIRASYEVHRAPPPYLDNVGNRAQCLRKYQFRRLWCEVAIDKEGSSSTKFLHNTHCAFVVRQDYPFLFTSLQHALQFVLYSYRPPELIIERLPLLPGVFTRKLNARTNGSGNSTGQVAPFPVESCKNELRNRNARTAALHMQKGWVLDRGRDDPLNNGRRN